MPRGVQYLPRNEAGRVRQLMRLDLMADYINANPGCSAYAAGRATGIHTEHAKAFIRRLRREGRIPPLAR